MDDGFSAFLVLLVILGVYFLPTIVACSRPCPYRAPVIIINILLGLTFIGWVVALIMAFLNPPTHQPIVIQNVNGNKSSAKANTESQPKQSDTNEQAEKGLVLDDSISDMDKLERLHQLKKEGAISQKEFDDAKKKILLK